MLAVPVMLIVVDGVTNWRCYMSLFAVYQSLCFSFLLWLFSSFNGFQSKHPSNEFVSTVRVWQRKLQRTKFGNLEAAIHYNILK